MTQAPERSTADSKFNALDASRTALTGDVFAAVNADDVSRDPCAGRLT